MESQDPLKTDFERALSDLLNSKNYKLDTVFQMDTYNQVLDEVRIALTKKSTLSPLTTKEYRRLKKFVILTLGGIEKLICAKSKPEIKYYVNVEECFSILQQSHAETGHKRQRVMEVQLKKKYSNITGEVIAA